MQALRAFAAAALVASVAGCAAQPPVRPQFATEPGMLVIGGGRFTMGRDGGEINERPSHQVDLDGFAIDRTEVPAVEFAAFLNARGNAGESFFTPDEQATVVMLPTGGGEARPRFAARPGYERYPANNVSWVGADACCRWLGKQLPTEAEWEKAARGTDGRRFPWGNRPPEAGLARFGQVWQQKRYDVFVPVDELPDGASPYGLLHMSGNVLEWVSDWYRQNYCDFCNPEREANLEIIQLLTGRPADGNGTAAGDISRQRQTPPRNNPDGPASGSFRVLRGGSWQDTLADDLTTTRRSWLDPAQRFPHTGFRCVKKESSNEP